MDFVGFHPKDTMKMVGGDFSAGHYFFKYLVDTKSTKMYGCGKREKNV